MLFTGFQEDCTCHFVQSVVKIRIPAQNLQINDVLYQVTQPVALYNSNDDTTGYCNCIGRTEMTVPLDKAKLPKLDYCNWVGENALFNSTDSNIIPTKQNMRLITTALFSFTPKDGNIHLSPEGYNFIRKWLLLSDHLQETG